MKGVSEHLNLAFTLIAKSTKQSEIARSVTTSPHLTGLKLNMKIFYDSLFRTTFIASLWKWLKPGKYTLAMFVKIKSIP
jgi:hypothetical protein